MEGDAEVGSPVEQSASPPVYHDKVAAVLFYCQFAMFIVLATYCIIAGRLSLQDEAVNAFRDILISVLAWSTGIIFIVSFFLTIIVHFAIKYAPTLMMHLASVTAFLLASLFSILTAFYISYIVGVLYGIMTLIIPIVYIRNLKHIPLSSSILEFVSETAHSHPSLVLMLVASTFAAQFYAGIAALSVWGIFAMMPKSIGVVIGQLAFLFTISVFWTAQVTLNVLRTIVAGVYGLDYEEPEERGSSSITMRMMKVAYGHGFGSICSGSTLVWIVSTIRFIFCKIQEFSPVQSDELDKIVTTLDRYARNFNYMAFNHVALRGQSYRQAANETWDQVRRSGVIKIMGDSYVSEFITFVGFSIAFIAAFVDMGIKCLYFGSTVEDLLKSFIGSILLGMVIPELYFMLIDSGTTSTLICFADNPETLKQSNPQLYETIQERYPELHCSVKDDAEQ